MNDITSRTKRHRAFWDCAEVERPLAGVIVGGWSAWADSPAMQGVLGQGLMTPEALEPAGFVAEWLDRRRRYAALGDDLLHTAQPFPGTPWLEAIAGCPVRRSESHLWAEPRADALERCDEIVWDPNNPWVRKYMEFLDVFGRELPEDCPIGQSVVRGPADAASALLGETGLVLALQDEPDRVGRLLRRLADLAASFLMAQAGRLRPFHGGMVIGQYDIWTPGWALRLQEDAVSLLSPALYREHVAPLDRRLCGLTRWNLFHLHTTSLHVLHDLLAVAAPAAVEISKDEGSARVDALLPHLRRVHESGRPLVVKGRFDDDEIRLLKRSLRPGGLCLQAVVNTWDEASDALRRLRSL
jgi:hypothetical protein